MPISKLGPLYDPNRNTGRPSMSFIYIGFVKSTTDVQRMGRLSVWIPEIGGSEKDPASWITVSYASPFAGATDIINLKKDSTKEDESQKSYGWWGVPPDLNNEVAVFFANGDITRGYWFACLYQQYMNKMVPGVGVDLTTDGGNKSVPVVEYNKYLTNSSINPASPRRPTFSALTNGLKTQGLEDDFERGSASTSARREAPSQVYGLITPRANTIHIDDNHERADPPKNADTQEKSTNEFIRLRTRSGAQVLIHETTGYIYINSKNGDAWLEISDAGSIDVFTTNSVSIRAKKDFNVRADENIILDAGKNVNIRAGNDITLECKHDQQVKVGHDHNTSISANQNVSIGKQLNLKSNDNIVLQAGKDFHQKTTGTIYRDGGKGIKDNTGGAKNAGSGSGSQGGQSGGENSSKAVNAMQTQLGNNGAQTNGFIQANGGTLDASRNNWCAATTNAALNAAGIQGTGSNVATSFLNWGNSVDGQAQSGDVIVEGRGLSAGQVGGHVGLATGDTRTVGGQLQYQMISGNYGGKVDYGWVNASSVTVRRASPTAASTSAMVQTASVESSSTRSEPVRLTKRDDMMRVNVIPALSAGSVKFDASNNSQQRLLSGIAQNEVSGKVAFNLGAGGTDLTGKQTYSNGFPVWDGYHYTSPSGKELTSHGSGEYQFEKGTWDTVASEHNLNFQNSADQSAGAWYLAQDIYAKKNPGDTLQAALDRGDNDKIASSLSGTWGTKNLSSYLASGDVNAPLMNAIGTQSTGTGGDSTAHGGDSSNDYATTTPDAATVPDSKKMPDSAKQGDKWVYGAASVDTIVSKMPTHEPWKPHPKSNVPTPPTEKLTPANSGNSGGNSASSSTDSKPSTEQACSFGADNTTSISNKSYNAITSAAHTVGVSLATMLAISDLVSGFDANASNSASGTTTTGLYQFSQATWDRMVQQYGHEYNISTDPTEITDPVSNATMGAQSINDATVQLIEMGISTPTTGQIYIMSYMGSEGGKKLIQAAQDTPDADATKMFPKNALNDPDLFDGSVSDVYNSLKEMGDSKGIAYDGQEGQPAPCDRTTAT